MEESFCIHKHWFLLSQLFDWRKGDMDGLRQELACWDFYLLKYLTWDLQPEGSHMISCIVSHICFYREFPFYL